jgi:hypothetical protein
MRWCQAGPRRLSREKFLHLLESFLKSTHLIFRKNERSNTLLGRADDKLDPGPSTYREMRDVRRFRLGHGADDWSQTASSPPLPQRSHRHSSCVARLAREARGRTYPIRRGPYAVADGRAWLQYRGGHVGLSSIPRRRSWRTVYGMSAPHGQLQTAKSENHILVQPSNHKNIGDCLCILGHASRPG